MLPTFPEIEDWFMTAFSLKLMDKVNQQAPLFAKSPRFVSFEGGNKVVYIGEDGKQQIIELHEFRAEETISHGGQSPSDGTPRDAMSTLDSISKQFAEQQEKMLLETLSQACDDSGNVISSEGRPFPEAFLEMLERIEIPFDGEGNPIMPTVVVPSNTKIIEEMEKREQDEMFKAKIGHIIDKKRKAWNEREADRQLVD